MVRTKALTWFEAKGKMEQIFKQLNLSINWKICSSLMFKEVLHLTVAELYLPDNSILGTLDRLTHISKSFEYLPNCTYLNLMLN
jgi:hypothetical protein